MARLKRPSKRALRSNPECIPGREGNGTGPVAHSAGALNVNDRSKLTNLAICGPSKIVTGTSQHLSIPTPSILQNTKEKNHAQHMINTNGQGDGNVQLEISPDIMAIENGPAVYKYMKRSVQKKTINQNLANINVKNQTRANSRRRYHEALAEAVGDLNDAFLHMQNCISKIQALVNQGNLRNVMGSTQGALGHAQGVVGHSHGLVSNARLIMEQAREVSRSGHEDGQGHDALGSVSDIVSQFASAIGQIHGSVGKVQEAQGRISSYLNGEAFVGHLDHKRCSPGDVLPSATEKEAHEYEPGSRIRTKDVTEMEYNETTDSNDSPMGILQTKVHGIVGSSNAQKKEVCFSEPRKETELFHGTEIRRERDRKECSAAQRPSQNTRRRKRQREYLKNIEERRDAEKDKETARGIIVQIDLKNDEGGTAHNNIPRDMCGDRASDPSIGDGLSRTRRPSSPKDETRAA